MTPLLLVLALLFGQQDNSYPLTMNQKFSIPETSDEELQEFLSNPRTIFYKLDRVYQYYQDGVWTVIDSDHLSDFNANQNFPWDNTFGLNTSNPDLYHTIDCFILPEGKEIAIINGRPVFWIFPPGTKFGEIPYHVNTPINRPLPFEVRSRAKLVDDWDVDVYRPVESPQVLCDILGVKEYEIEKKYFEVENPEDDKSFQLAGHIEYTPNMNNEQKVEALSRPFKNVTGVPWSGECSVPAGRDVFDIFPKDYTLGLLSPDNISCSQCHRQTFISVTRLVPREPAVVRNESKIGRIRGYDGIFSWHPFDPSTVSFDGRIVPRLKFRNYDIKNKIIALYDPVKHADYRLTRYVEEALKSEELPVNLPDGEEGVTFVMYPK